MNSCITCHEKVEKVLSLSNCRLLEFEGVSSDSGWPSRDSCDVVQQEGSGPSGRGVKQPEGQPSSLSHYQENEYVGEGDEVTSGKPKYSLWK